MTLLASVFTGITLMFSPPALFLRTSQRYPLLQRGTSVTISWGKVSKATDYIVEHYVNGAWKQVGTTSSLSYKVNGITQNGVNKFRVKARRNYSGVYYNGGYICKR